MSPASRFALSVVPNPALARLAATIVALVAGGAGAQTCISLVSQTYRQSFDGLAASGAGSSTMPAGFAFVESGTSANSQYAPGNGSVLTGNTYSFGTGTSTERALGELSTTTLQSTFGACFMNNQGFAITSLVVGYTGEQWRLGVGDLIPDRLDFQYSLDATSLTTGTWVDFDSLDFLTPNNSGASGQRDGNAAVNRRVFAPTRIVPATKVPVGGTFFVRWKAHNLSGDNDGLAVDDFSISALQSGDFDGDNDEDGADFLRWQRGYRRTTGVSFSTGDANGDGLVDGTDLSIWRAQFGAAVANAAVRAVPEPSAPRLAATSAVLLTLAVRRRDAPPISD